MTLGLRPWASYKVASQRSYFKTASRISAS